MGALSGGFPRVAEADDEQWFPVDDAGAVGAVRHTAVTVGTRLGLPAAQVAELAILATELAGNLHKHADEGLVLLRSLRLAPACAVELISVDSGPGVPDLHRALRDGHSTAGTLGIGLGAIGRLASWWDMYSRPGAGTVLATQVWSPGPPVPAWAHGITRPIPGEWVSGDGYAVRSVADRGQVLLCDGLGHGPLAASATRTAISAFHAAPQAGPAAVVAHLHEALARTRGAAVMVAELDPGADRLRAAGLGNIAGYLLFDGGRRQLVCLPGIAGHRRHKIREFDYELPAGGVLVLHSDGVTDRWDIDRYPGLLEHSPLTIAATLMRDGGTRRDDASALVARAP